MSQWRRRQLQKEFGIDPVEHVRLLAADGYGPKVVGDILGVCRKTVKTWAAEAGVELPKRTRSEKIQHSGRSQAAIDAAAQKKHRWIEWSGGKERMIDAAARLGITPEALACRLKRWGVEQAMTEPKRKPFHGVVARKASNEHPWRDLK